MQAQHDQKAKADEWWYAAPAILGREEAVQAFRMKYGRDPEVVEAPGYEECGLWLLGPVTAAEAEQR